MLNGLISRAEAIDIVRSMTISLDGTEIFHPEAKKSVLCALDEIPVVDAVPVVHARYVYYDGYAIPNCSACGFSITDIEWAFCPHCGAMLDESGETK